MLFNSFEYLIFLPLVFTLYWILNKHSVKSQNVLILIVSYIFYGWWDWRFLSLIAFSSIVDYIIALKIDGTSDQKSRKLYLIFSLVTNLGILGFFKYSNFFIESFSDLIGVFGLQVNELSLNIILPVGISFYTFQTLSYTIDVYRRNMKPTKDLLAFSAYVSFFPQLVAGPIERATNLLPQFHLKRKFDYGLACDGLRQILWGLFKKIVIADNCATLVNDIFANYTELSTPVLLLGAFYFAFQIYGDFSGYSDIAIGTSKLFGIKLMINFKYPYFSRDIAEFWRRWHISLSTWFRDYLYIPLGGSKVSKLHAIKNILIIFAVSGFWHGSRWTFVVWGVLNALYFIPLFILNKNRKNIDLPAENRLLPSFRELFGIVITFSLTCFAWIFFRSDTLTDAFSYINRMADFDLSISAYYLKYIPFIITLLFIEWIQRSKEHPLQIANFPILIRYGVYYFIVGVIFLFGFTGANSFIYFQF